MSPQEQRTQVSFTVVQLSLQVSRVNTKEVNFSAVENTVCDSGKFHFQTQTLRPRLSQAWPPSTRDFRDRPGHGRPVGGGGKRARRVMSGSVMSQPGKGCPPPLAHTLLCVAQPQSPSYLQGSLETRPRGEVR